MISKIKHIIDYDSTSACAGPALPCIVAQVSKNPPHVAMHDDNAMRKNIWDEYGLALNKNSMIRIIDCKICESAMT